MLVTRMYAHFPKRLPYHFFNTAKRRAMISCMVFIVIFSIGIVFFVYPLKVSLAQLDAEISSTKNAIRIKQDDDIQQNRILKLRQQLEQVLNPFYITQPDYLVTTQLITQIEQWSKHHNLLLQKVIWGELTEHEYFTTQPVNLQFSGNYFQLISLFEYIGGRYGVVNIVEFTMQSQDVNVSPQVSLDLELHIVILKS